MRGKWDHFCRVVKILRDFILIVASFFRFSAERDSSKKKNIIHKVKIEIIHPMMADPKKPSEKDKERDQIAGPIMREKPKIAPLIPKIFERSFLSVMSAIIAWATDTFPQVTPSNIRERKITNIGSST